MNVKVVTDSGSGISQKEADQLGIGLLPLQVLNGETQYLDGVNLDTEKLYEMLEDGDMPTTSQPPLLLEEELFESYKKEGITDIIVINLSNGLSSTNQTVQATARRIGLNVHTLDICTTLAVQKYLTVAAKQLLDTGMAPEQIIETLQKAVDGSAGYLIVEDLNHLAAGGRLTPMAAKLGGMLKIKPILQVSKNSQGKVDLFGKVRTFSKALKKAADQIESELQPDVEYEYFLLNGANDEGLAQAKENLMALGADEEHIHVMDMFPVIACHTGLGSIGYQYIPRIEGVVFK